MADGQPDLQINYDQLHKLANDARTLKDNLDNEVPGLSTGISGVRKRSEAIGSQKLSSSLIKFHTAWEQPFKDAMDRLGDLAGLLDGVATKFFDMDSDFATKSSSSLASLILAQWQGKKDEWDRYQATKDLKFTPSPLWDEHGNKVQGEAVPLIPWGTIPEDPGARPTHTDAQSIYNEQHKDNKNVSAPVFDGNPAKTDSQYDESGRLTSQTSKNTSQEGLAYETTTTYKYEGDSERPSSTSTTLKHGDGSTETIETKYTYDSDGQITSFVSDNKFDDPDDDDNDSTSTTTTTPTRDAQGNDTGYTAVSVEDGKETKVEVTNNKTPDGTAIDAKIDNDVKVMTDEDGTVRKWKGNADTDDWTQTEGPGLYEDEDD
ncbi:hypothetical protein LWF15_09215 [Kineosporia rhizophila]|uniref:hypothetical protein n=1 Tax=Kineosporia TaxID=49184 RepID=UPI000AC890D0|nr:MULTISPECIES: hypothetical protein [Kineosporia]MCE0535691.1 hypothetical protein [Kineosporia rhizophila]GLY17663.1 hypothetical protein Kisp01_46770 [Kineosporia sp. NBRC 101677]